MCEKVIEYGKQGMSKTEMAVNLGVRKETLYNWMDKHEEFFNAIKAAEDAAETWYAKAFRTMALGGYDKPNATALIFQAKNQLPNVYKDRRETHVEGKVGVFEIDFTGYDDDDNDYEAE
jgi:hypothetical protein